jgi:aspartyl-tRNA(Asn)/glutamyl-tRNA(Gln) amidotransferase subunit A
LLLHAGPIARTVRDAALMLNAMAGAHRRDPLSIATERVDFLRGIDAGIAGARVAWSADLGFLSPEPETHAIAQAAARVFEELGVSVDEADLKLSDPSWILDSLFGGNSAGLHSRRPPEEKAQMDPGLVAYAQAGARLSIADYVKAVVARQAIVDQLGRFFERYDLLLTPTTALPAFALGRVDPASIAGRPVTHLAWSLAYVFNWSGQPAISVPAGWTQDGLPVGLHIIGRRLEDDLVLRAAAALEAARPWSQRWPAVDRPS